MSSIHAIHLGRMRWGLFGLAAALVLDAIDLEVEDIDPLHDGAALAFYALFGLGVGQKAVREHGAQPLAFWTPFVVRASAYALPFISKELTRSTWVSLGLLLGFGGALILCSLGLSRIAAGAGLVSSNRWRSSALHVGLLLMLPGAATAFMMTRPATQLPMLPDLGSLDSTWWKQGLRWVVMAAALVATLSVLQSAWATWRSAGRRT